MMLPTIVFLLASLPFLEATAIAPGHRSPTPLERRQANCQNPGGVRGIDPSCWETLGMTKYTQDWWAKNSADCTGVGFSTCFFGKHGLGTRDCTGIKPQFCPVPDFAANSSAQDFYIFYNIYAINEVFNSLWTAVGNANGLAADSVGAIVKLLNPTKPPQNLLLNDLLTALSAGLALIPGSASEIVNLVVHAAQQAPGVVKYLFPVGTTQTQVDQWASISNEIGNLVKTYQDSLSKIIPVINNDVNNFIAYASTGGFSVFPAPGIDVESDVLLKGLHTYIISQALAQNNIQITRAVDTDVHELQTNSSNDLAFDTGCTNDYDAAGICGGYWFDSKAKITYSLDNYHDMSTQYHDTLEAIFGNWTTGELLFGGAARCAASGGAKETLAQTIVGGNGVITSDCLSNGKICTWDVTSDTSTGEFTDCPAQPGYFVDGCAGGRCGNSGDMAAINVPNAYLGGNLFTDTCVCNY